MLFGMGDPHETPTFDTTVQWDFLPQVIDVAVSGCRRWPTRRSRTRGPDSTRCRPTANPIIGAGARRATACS